MRTCKPATPYFVYTAIDALRGWPLQESGLHGAATGAKLICIEGQVLQENATMLDMCRQLGFRIADDPNDRTMKVVRLELE